MLWGLLLSLLVVIAEVIASPAGFWRGLALVVIVGIANVLGYVEGTQKQGPDRA